MGDLLEISDVGRCRIFFERSMDSRKRFYFSAHIQFQESDQIVLDDRILPRLKRRLRAILDLRTIYGMSP